MTYDVMGPGALDYLPCRYGQSKLLFRGPKRRLDAPYLAFLGGTETYGKYIKTPFPALVETDLGTNCINLGFPNAGLDVFANDGFVIDAACRAQVTVVQIMGAQNISNRYYSVHPRRNDRFVTPSVLLSTIYRDVDFAEFHFNKHMLSRLYTVSPDRFATVRSELQSAWLARMRLTLKKIQGKIVLLWFADHAPLRNEPIGQDPTECSNPLFVTREMMDEVAPLATEVVEVVATPQAVQAGTEGMVFSQMEAMAAAEMLGPKAHGEAEAQLAKVLHGMI